MIPDGCENPEAYIARDVRQALAAGTPIPDRREGAVLFADLSGFTRLTEALSDELGPNRGADALIASLNRTFSGLIGELDGFGGHVVYFAGDAITAWLDGDDGRRAIAAALAMQQAIRKIEAVQTPAGHSLELGLKVSIATGAARRFVVGDPSIQRIDVLAGRLLDEVADAESLARPGEILVSARVERLLGADLLIDDRRISEKTGMAYCCVQGLALDVPCAAVQEPPTLPPEQVRSWLLPPVYERVTAGRGEFFAESRPVYPLFLRFSGIDFDADVDAFEKLNAFICRAQQVFSQYGGYLLQLNLGDKGAYLYGVFGAPVAHQDDAARASAAALDLLHLQQSTAVDGIQVGLAFGQLHSGTYGHPMRRTFACLGDAVNTAARLMSKAPSGGIYVTESVMRAAGENFVWGESRDWQLKGKTRAVRSVALVSSLDQMSRRKRRYEMPLFGRSAEVAALEAAVDAAIKGKATSVGLCAEAGMGKSRLLAEFVRSTRHRGVRVVMGECQAAHGNSSYQVWREIWCRLLGVEEDQGVATQREAATRAIRQIDPGLVPRVPLLAEVLGISIPDTSLTAALDPKLRKTSLENLLSQCLCHQAKTEPLVIVLEDTHWLDALSQDLLEMLARAVLGLPVLFVLAYRPSGGGGETASRFGLTGLDEYVLGDLDTPAMRLLVAAKAKRLFGFDEAPEGLVERVTERAQGNPFYAEELLSLIASRGVSPSDPKALESLDLPDSLNSLVLSRTDLLEEEARRNLKVASVFGRVFKGPDLSAAYSELGKPEEVKDVLGLLVDEEILAHERLDLEAYLFRHGVICEVTYNSLPWAIRSELHRRIGSYFEHLYEEDLEPRLDLLAHHFWNSDDEEKKREYLLRAEEHARNRYANQAAIDYGRRLLPLVSDRERVDVLLRLGGVLELTGEWAEAESAMDKAKVLAREIAEPVLLANCDAALAEVARKQGNFQRARELLVAAESGFSAASDFAGLSRVKHLAGTVAAQKGDYAAARKAYQGSLFLREQTGDRKGVAALYSNLAVVAEYEGAYDEALAANEKALRIREELGDRWAIGVSQNNLGMIALLQRDFERARHCFEEAMRLNREVGDAWMVAICHNNLGNAQRELGELDEASQSYAHGLRDHLRIADDWGLTFLLEDVAILAVLRDAAEPALTLLGAADGLRQSIGSPRGEALARELDSRIGPIEKQMAERAADCRALGRQMKPEQAVYMALSFCSGN